MAVFLCDRNAVILQYNHRAVELWGREPTCGVEKHCGSTRLWLPDGTLGLRPQWLWRRTLTFRPDALVLGNDLGAKQQQGRRDFQAQKHDDRGR